MAVFSNGTEYSWFQDSVCAFCVRNVDGQACDEVALPAISGETPPMLVRVATSPGNPLGVECAGFVPIPVPIEKD